MLKVYCMVFERIKKLFRKKIPTEYDTVEVGEDDKIAAKVANFGLKKETGKKNDKFVYLLVLKSATEMERVRILMQDYPVILIRTSYVNRDKESMKRALLTLQVNVTKQNAKLAALDDNWLVVAGNKVDFGKLTKEAEGEYLTTTASMPEPTVEPSSMKEQEPKTPA